MAVKERWLKANPINITTEDAVSSLLELFKADERIKLVYLFGSRSAKSASSDSDIDFALYADENFSWQDLYLLIERCGKRLSSDRVDLVWLNPSEPIITFEIIKNGKVLFYTDPDLLNDFELKAKKRYYDYCLYLKKHRRFRENGV